MLIRDYRTLVFMALGEGKTRSFPLEGPSFGVLDDDDSVAWSDDSRSVWFLKGETARSGFSTGPMVTARRRIDGRIDLAPALKDPPGRLDQVRWVDGSGLGVASFDLRGGYYRPELPNTAPTLAVIEAATGRIRSRIPVRSGLLAAWGAAAGEIHCHVFASTLMSDGRVRSLLRAGAFVPDGRPSIGGPMIWTEGEAPVLLPPDILKGSVAFADSGRKLLVRLPLQASGIIFERAPSPPPTPVSGDYAGLYDIENGRWVWRLSGRSTDWGEGRGVAVSASGRIGLIGLPASCGYQGAYGLVDVRSGRIQQRLLAPNNSTPTLGLNGEKPWMAWGGIVDLYGGSPFSGWLALGE